MLVEGIGSSLNRFSGQWAVGSESAENKKPPSGDVNENHFLRNRERLASPPGTNSSHDPPPALSERGRYPSVFITVNNPIHYEDTEEIAQLEIGVSAKAVRRSVPSHIITVQKSI